MGFGVLFRLTMSVLFPDPIAQPFLTCDTADTNDTSQNGDQPSSPVLARVS
jgi:hypothetical protein